MVTSTTDDREMSARQTRRMASLVSVEELRDSLDEVTVLDVRWRMGRADGHEEYLAGHVPAASYVDMETDLADPPARPVDGRGRHPLPDADRFAAGMRRCGVSAGRPVVIYDDWAGMAAARAWWLLRYHGKADVALLDGGYTAWSETGFETERGEHLGPSGDFTPDPGHLPVVDATGAARVAAHGGLLDARSPERFRGEVEPLDPVAGHVPGARCAPATDNVRGGRFRPPAELREVYSAVQGVAELGAYCGSGVTAAHDLFALHLIGREGALFAGSWSGWVADPDSPVGTGDQDG
jgi:thiosulfate/3-mercaptopyruvate sulfurtransferase